MNRIDVENRITKVVNGAERALESRLAQPIFFGVLAFTGFGLYLGGCDGTPTNDQTPPEQSVPVTSR